MKQNTKGGHLRFMSDEVVQKKGKRPAVRQNRWKEAGNVFGSLSGAAGNKSETDVTEDTISLAGRSAERASEGIKQNIYSRKLKEYT